MNNIIGHIEYGLRGDSALFSDINMSGNGMPLSYKVPTFGSIRAITGNIYRHKKPFNFDWEIEKIRVMNKIDMKNITYSFTLDGFNRRSRHTFLNDVHYQISGRIKYSDGILPQHDKNHEDNAVKAERIFIKNIYKPYQNIYFGRAECQAFANLEEFGSGVGYYDYVDEVEIGNMFIQFDYLDDNPYGKKLGYYANIIMRNGIITLPNKNECYTKIFS